MTIQQSESERALAALWKMAQQEPDFAVVQHDPAGHDASRPLIVVVHPGDVVETPAGFTARDWAKVGAFSRDNQDGMASEISTWREAGADVVVLHRLSCAYLDDGEEVFQEAVLGCWDGGTILYGDALDEAATWIIENLHVADRPMIHMAGAYVTPEDGCVTHIGKAIEAIVGEDRMTVSDWSPASNCAADKVWRPGDRSIPFWDAQGDGWRKAPKGRARKSNAPAAKAATDDPST